MKVTKAFNGFFKRQLVFSIVYTIAWLAQLRQAIRYPRSRLLPLILIATLLTASSCSRPRISIKGPAPVSFQFSGDNTIMMFRVVDERGVRWEIIPRRKGISFRNTDPITYGTVPESWEQQFPKDAPPQPLIEGEKYQAFAVVFDSDIVRVHFRILNGQPVEIIK